MGKLPVPKAENFLFCISLRSGVKFLGWVFLVGHFVAMFDTPLRNFNIYWSCDLIPLYEDSDTGSHICPDWLSLKLLTTAIADLVLSVLQICTAFLLLMGVYEGKPRLILQWVILQSAMLLADITLTQLSYLREDIRLNVKYFYAIYITWKSIEAYGIFICYSYYMSMKKDPQFS